MFYYKKCKYGIRRRKFISVTQQRNAIVYSIRHSHPIELSRVNTKQLTGRVKCNINYMLYTFKSRNQLYYAEHNVNRLPMKIISLLMFDNIVYVNLIFLN